MPEPTELKGQWALILGASSGMGAACARVLAAQGANIIGVHFDTAAAQPGIDALVAELQGHGVTAEYCNINAANAKARAETVARIEGLAAGTGVRILLHSLAFGTLLPYIAPEGEAITARQIAMTLDVMANSLVYWTQDLHAAGLLRDGAKVYAMTSAGDLRVTSSYGAVSAAKCALAAHARQLAVELAPHGVAVNLLRAGVTVTPSLERIPEHRELIDKARSGNPHGRLTTPEDVAEFVALLSRTDSAWMTGNVIGIDGGEALTT
ncbi:SDR family oxidoreductase [Glycomyces tritici]|uniref:SDR family oxidoreductase n=1 Tax=Glycomyces tritici TaxID=2665176 RepID=A0ABT7YYS8_9ACTN|nr:SDR family oxidoreductase [Glycomyces tritici]MDN3243804.1 SDR family oxidoreductase [Glycomyces tritici]